MKSILHLKITVTDFNTFFEFYILLLLVTSNRYCLCCLGSDICILWNHNTCRVHWHRQKFWLEEPEMEKSCDVSLVTFFG